VRAWSRRVFLLPTAPVRGRVRAVAPARTVQDTAGHGTAVLKLQFRGMALPKVINYFAEEAERLLASSKGRQTAGNSADGLGEEAGGSGLPDRPLLPDGAGFRVRPGPLAGAGLLRDASMAPYHPVFPDPGPDAAHSADPGKWRYRLWRLTANGGHSPGVGAYEEAGDGSGLFRVRRERGAGPWRSSCPRRLPIARRSRSVLAAAGGGENWPGPPGAFRD
jgi:hypothetical protein